MKENMIVKTTRQGVIYMIDGREIELMPEEIEVYNIVVTILLPYIQSERITFMKSNGYFVVCIDNDENKKVCKFYLNRYRDYYLIYFDDNKKEQKVSFSDFDDISGYYSERFIDTTLKFR